MSLLHVLFGESCFIVAEAAAAAKDRAATGLLHICNLY